jgi:hypothetical protein
VGSQSDGVADVAVALEAFAVGVTATAGVISTAEAAADASMGESTAGGASTGGSSAAPTSCCPVLTPDGSVKDAGATATFGALSDASGAASKLTVSVVLGAKTESVDANVERAELRSDTDPAEACFADRRFSDQPDADESRSPVLAVSSRVESEAIESDSAASDSDVESPEVEPRLAESDVDDDGFVDEPHSAGSDDVGTDFGAKDFVEDDVRRDAFARNDVAGESTDAESEEPEDSVEVELGDSAQATPLFPAMAAPMPKATARPPTRPIWASPRICPAFIAMPDLCCT